MTMRAFVTAILFVPLAAIAAGAFTSIHPEAAIPDPAGPISQSPSTGFISRVQERLRALGFDAGPVNGDFGEKTQAALAQFQLSQAIPAGGQLDERTLAELGVARDEAQASAGASAPSADAPSADASAQPSTEQKPGT